MTGKRKTQIEEYIRTERSEGKSMPTLQAIADAVGLADRGSVYPHVQKLLADGVLEKVDTDKTSGIRNLRLSKHAEYCHASQNERIVQQILDTITKSCDCGFWGS